MDATTTTLLLLALLALLVLAGLIHDWRNNR